MRFTPNNAPFETLAQLAELVLVAEAQQRLAGNLIDGLPRTSVRPLLNDLNPAHDHSHARCDATKAAVAKRKETARVKTNSVSIRASHQALCDPAPSEGHYIQTTATIAVTSAIVNTAAPTTILNQSSLMRGPCRGT
jgi:hypothetical protein